MGRFRKFRRYGGRARRYSSKGAKLLGMSTPQIIGVLIGMSNLDNNIPKNLVLGLAVAPTGMLKGLLPVSNAAKGIILGNMLQGFGIGIPGMNTQSSDARSF